MKKTIILILLTAILTTAAGCTGKEKDEEASVSASSPTVIHRESSAASQQSSIPVSSAQESRLPDGVHEDKEGFLRYTSPGKEITAVFSSEFNTEMTEYRPAVGIMLTNGEGNATLQIESVKNQGVSRNDLVDYLKENYSDAEVVVNDKKQIICKSKAKDGSGKEVMAYLKAAVTDNGYNEVILFFDKSEKSKYETVFNRITLS